MSDVQGSRGGRGGRGRGKGPNRPQKRVPTPTVPEAIPSDPVDSAVPPEAHQDTTEADPKPEPEDEIFLTAVTPADILDDSCRTFIFKDEGHTLGNTLRTMISNYPETRFVGHTIPHPSENEMHLRIQTSGVSAVEILRRGLSDMVSMLEVTEEIFTEAIGKYKKENPIVQEEVIFVLPPIVYASRDYDD